MSNPIFQQFQGGNPFMNSFVQRLNALKSSFNGDPMQQVQQMLNSGRITQAQYDRAVQQAQQIIKMIKQ